MNKDELFDAVREINILIEGAQRNANEANATLKQSLPLLKELLNATRNESTQMSLDEFATKSDELSPVINGESVAKESIAPRLISELLTLEDVRKMIEEDKQ
jgi:hypothetical protein|tara:strand:- start:909 stop:1214 length:306 start_codon:yes stop_codon:yes gene_type:complete